MVCFSHLPRKQLKKIWSLTITSATPSCEGDLSITIINYSGGAKLFDWLFFLTAPPSLLDSSSHRLTHTRYPPLASGLAATNQGFLSLLSSFGIRSIISSTATPLLVRILGLKMDLDDVVSFNPADAPAEQRTATYAPPLPSFEREKKIG